MTVVNVIVALVRGLEISPKNSSAKFTQTFCHKNSMARGCEDSPKLNFSDFMLYVNKSPQKICCSSFNAQSIMEVIVRIEKGFYPKHHLVQLHRKPITTTKAFSFLYKRTIHHFHLFRYRASLFAHMPTMTTKQHPR